MLNTWIKSVLGGAAISIGAVVFFSVDNRVAGAFLFSIGLFTIYTFGLHLYTGKVCLIPKNPPSFFAEIATVYAGNLAGTLGMGCLLRLTRLAHLQPAVHALAAAKLGDTPLSAFVLAVLCGVMMCIAVLGFTTLEDRIGKYFALVMPIMVFLLSGFEHSIANLFYFSFAGLWSGKALLYSALYALGNMAGGVILPLASRLK